MAKCDFHETRGWGNSYCLKKDDYVSNDTYNNYCNTYRYDDCPIYRQSSGSSGCYLTTACVEHRGMADDCRELTVLRTFRDEYLMNIPGGKKDVCRYYHTAPGIVKAIESDSERETILESLYSEVIVPCVELIEAGEHKAAYERYKKMVTKLDERYN